METKREDDDAPVWLFDGYCLLCSRSVKFMLRREREPRLRFVAIQSPLGRRLAQSHGVDPDDPETFLFLHRGRALAKSEGVLASLRLLRFPWPLLARLLRLAPRPLRDRAYEAVARNRYRLFGRSAACMAPTPQQRARFTLPADAP